MRSSSRPFFAALISIATVLAACSGSSDNTSQGGGDTGTGNSPRDDARVGTPDDAGTNNGDPDSGTMMGEPDSGIAPMCTNLTLFADTDMDTYGTSTDTQDACLLPGEELAGYSRQAGDCSPADPWANPGAEEICNDHVDDNCDSADSPCPATQTAGIEFPNWDCVNGTAPNNVFAYALFSDGAPYYQPNACFIFFEGLTSEFYAQRVNLTRVSQAASCTNINGCVCPSLENWPSYDRRLYAWTLAGEAANCAEIRIIDHGGEMQPVSNDCRKYLFPLHVFETPNTRYDFPYTYVASSLEGIDRRLALFPTLEIACASEQYRQLPFQTLLTAPIQRNPGFVKK